MRGSVQAVWPASRISPTLSLAPALICVTLFALAGCCSDPPPGPGPVREGDGRPTSPPVSLEVVVDAPDPAAWVTSATVVVRGRALRPVDGGAGPLLARVGDGAPVPVAPSGEFEAPLRLPDGVHRVPVVVTAAPGASPAEGRTTHVVRVDRTPPRLLVSSPHDGLRTGAGEVWLRARVADAQPWVEVTIAGAGARRVVRLERGQPLDERLELPLGTSRIELEAVDALGHAATLSRVVTREEGFFGLPVTADHVVFVIDTSGSMVLLDRPEGYPLSEADLRRADPGDAAVRDLARITRAKTELSAAIRGLRPDQRFNVIAFASDVRPWRADLVAADEQARASALDFVAALSPGGLTRTRDALEAALGATDVEAIYLLSDGAPADRPGPAEALRQQAHEGAQACLALARERAVPRGVRLHVLGMDGPGLHLARWGPRDTPDDPDYLRMLRRFLEELARVTGGSFRSL